MNFLQIIHCIAAFIVLAEALNKLERCSVLISGLTPHQRTVEGLKALAWALLSIGAAGALATPILSSLGVDPAPWDAVSHGSPSTAETAILTGFAVLIVRTRVKEG